MAHSYISYEKCMRTQFPIDEANVTTTTKQAAADHRAAAATPSRITATKRWTCTRTSPRRR